MATFLPALMIASGAMQAYGAYAEGQQQSKVAKYNADISRQQISAIEASKNMEIEKQRRAARKLRGTQEALYSKAGVSFSGSPLEVMVESAANAELDILMTDYNARMQQANAEAEARKYEWQGKQAKRAGMFKAGSTLLTSAISYGNTYGFGSPKSNVIQGGVGGRTMQTSQFGKVWSPY